MLLSENINVYKPKVIFIRKDNYYNFAHIFVKINSSDRKLKKEEKKNTFNPILKRNEYFGENCLRNGDWASGKENSAMRQRHGKKQTIICWFWPFKPSF